MKKLVDFGGSGPVIQLLHANAYTPECYNKFVEPLTHQYSVRAFRQRPLWEGECPSQLKNWSMFADDLIAMMDEYGHKNVIGIGHSLGGIATWLASIRRPDLFSRIVLIDPVIMPQPMVRVTQFIPYWYKRRKIPIVKIALNRRNQWKDREEVRAHLGAKKVFQRFDPEVFEDFLNYGIVDQQRGVTLAYPREWEARVYGTAPNLWKIMPKTTIPVHIIKAQYSDVISEDTWIKTQGNTKNATFYEMPKVGHLIPFEKPLILADYIVSFLTRAQE